MLLFRRKLIQQKLLKKQDEDEHSSSPPVSSRCHFIQRINQSQLAKVISLPNPSINHFDFQKRYIAPTNQESLKLHSIIGYNGNGRKNLIWYPSTGFFAYTVTCNIIVENLNSSSQTILSGIFEENLPCSKRLSLIEIGHTEEISTLALSNDGTVLASAQCSMIVKKDEFQAKIIVWNTQTLRQTLIFHQAVQAVQSMVFSK